MLYLCPSALPARSAALHRLSRTTARSSSLSPLEGQFNYRNTQRQSFVGFDSHLTTPTLMPTIASSAPPQRPPPGDADLQELYDQVLSAFADESSPSNFSPTFSISRSNNLDYDESVYSPSDEGVTSQISSRTHPPSYR